ncbi:MAG: hydrogenase expression/formation protein HypE [Candidatus Latescibacterota bacterium]|jgi:hydrogenase expression/formation protein HypE
MSGAVSLACPVPLRDYPRVLLAHGGGGRLMADLIERIFLPAFDNPYLRRQHDGAVVPLAGVRVALSTDSYVVSPLFFPGGDIGTLAVNGTVNDLAMCGARPLYLTAGFIIEEGLPMEQLTRVAGSMRRAALAAGVALVTGDTKVVERGKGDGLFINSAGIGLVAGDLEIGPERVVPGDAILLSGDVGRHGVAIMARREGLEFESTVTSDCAPLAGPVLALLEAGIEVHCLRDLTRGGLATALVEITESAGLTTAIQEQEIEVTAEVQGACEILGLDPLYVANEGRFVAFVPEAEADRAREILAADPVTAGARIVGRVIDRGAGGVVLENRFGTRRALDRLSGEQLPRIC